MVLHFNDLRRYPLSDLNFCLQASYAFRELLHCQISRNSNERFLRKQFISTETTNHNFLVKCACKNKQKTNKLYLTRVTLNSEITDKPLGARTRTNNKLNPHLTPSPGIEPGPHWWEACVGGKFSTTAPSLLPLRCF